MWIKDLELINFRNYPREKFNFIKGVNVIHGDNGQGKTNLIEAISYISTLSSFRNSKNDDVIKNEEDIGFHFI
jgi:DNA replication and repair protein RecF